MYSKIFLLLVGMPHSMHGEASSMAYYFGVRIGSHTNDPNEPIRTRTNRSEQERTHERSEPNLNEPIRTRTNRTTRYKIRWEPKQTVPIRTNDPIWSERTIRSDPNEHTDPSAQFKYLKGNKLTHLLANPIASPHLLCCWKYKLHKLFLLRIMLYHGCIPVMTYRLSKIVKVWAWDLHRPPLHG